ncbi:protein of unknown function [Paraburkholderia kururiensis]
MITFSILELLYMLATALIRAAHNIVSLPEWQKRFPGHL